jgi:two-component system, probable response regulator PhcQ
MPSDKSTASILLVDDEPHVTEALSRHLSRHYQIFTSSSAAAAYGILAGQSIDVVVSDERMPGESGSEFLASVRRRYPDSIRMILSGQASLEAAVRAINEGEVYRFFLKPCNPIDLLFTIQRALELKRLEKHSRELLRQFRRQASELAALHGSQTGLLELNLDATGAILMEDEDPKGSVEDLLREMEQSLALNRARPITGR